MKSCLLLTTLIIIIATGCTKIVAGPTEVIGPELTYTDRAIVTVGDAITNVTVYPPFSTAQDNHMNFLNPSISALQIYASWKTINDSGQEVEIGSVVQTTANIAATVMHGFGNCTVELYQNEEISHYTDGTSTHRPVGAQYYVIVKAE
ncbi:MAG TPA: hypothetical protein PKM63_02290 [Panacibacter sp.]|nr:hypothetical protein [Panacibacter sp.]HNP43084.1 hypothetical protein [Panacibacter sp.]